ncbi:MAG: ribosome biogenesis GTPase YlqF [Myxococcota bacterium]|nr:ribosome biogenesis GTPase YlqF [Myxococcota bacterium]
MSGGRINWFPGHMNKARREIAKAMPKVDLVMEVLDARIPGSSSNPLVPELRGETPFLKILNKADLADPGATGTWIRHLENEPGVRAIPVQKDKMKEVKGLVDVARGMLPERRKGGRPILAMILGIPNVGKSTLINTMCGKAIAKVGNRPAVTQHQARIKVGKDIVLLDTPGFLWPRLDPPECGSRLAVTGAIRDAVLDLDEVAFFAVRFMSARYPDLLREKYGLETVPAEPYELLERIGARRGCLGKGGMLDLQKVCEIFLRELRAGTVGRFTLEWPAAS